MLLLIGLFSCSRELASHEFESYKWSKNKVVNLSFENDSKEKDDLVLEVRSIFGFNHPNLEIEFVLTQPDGQKISTKKKMSFDKDLMECSGDFCDQLVTIQSDYQFTEGSYSLDIKPMNSKVDLLGFMEFRLIRK